MAMMAGTVIASVSVATYNSDVRICAYSHAGCSLLTKTELRLISAL